MARFNALLTDDMVYRRFVDPKDDPRPYITCDIEKLAYDIRNIEAHDITFEQAMSYAKGIVNYAKTLRKAKE